MQHSKNEGLRKQQLTLTFQNINTAIMTRLRCNSENGQLKQSRKRRGSGDYQLEDVLCEAMIEM